MNIINYVEYYKKRARMEKEALKEYRKKVMDSLMKGAVPILKKNGVKKIVLFGSLLSDEFSFRSDVDLACEGIPEEKFFKIYGELLMNMDFNIDLVDVNEAYDFIKIEIEKGKVLYDADKHSSDKD